MSTLRSGRFREEVLNVKLAELLSLRGVLSVPETILSHISAGRRLPDVIAATYLGILVVIEGRVSDTTAVRRALESRCRTRIEEGIGAIVIGVMYPPEVRQSRNLTELERAIEAAELSIKVFTEGEEIDWVLAGINDLAQILQHGYENLIKEDVVEAAVEQLREVIESVVPLLATHSATEERLREILVVPRRG